MSIPDTTHSAPPRMAVLFDYVEEQWPSMDLCARQLLSGLTSHHARDVSARRVCPPYRARAVKVPLVGRSGTALNVDRLLNRQWFYLRHVRRIAPMFDAFHVCDHSYAQLVHALPAERTGVFCHDLDAFRCLLTPNAEQRPRWFRAMARRVLTGLQKAAIVFHPTLEVRRQIEMHALVDPARLVHAPLGVDEAFTRAIEHLHTADSLLNDFTRGRPFLLNVGSCIPRKRIDVLLDTFARLRKHHAELRLVQVGGTWTGEQQARIDDLKLYAHVTQLRGIPTGTLAAIYHRAAVVVQTTEAEGFGLPIAEALACGAAVVASDLPVLREVGGDACVFAPVGDVAAFARAVDSELTRHTAPPRAARVVRAKQFSWDTHSRAIIDAYMTRVLKAASPSDTRTGTPVQSVRNGEGLT